MCHRCAIGPRTVLPDLRFSRLSLVSDDSACVGLTPSPMSNGVTSSAPLRSRSGTSRGTFLAGAAVVRHDKETIVSRFREYFEPAGCCVDVARAVEEADALSDRPYLCIGCHRPPPPSDATRRVWMSRAVYPSGIGRLRL